MSNEWMSGKQPDIPYNDPLCRMAYLYSTVPVNANLVEYVFEHDHELESYLDDIQAKNGRVSICAFGAGPGTELLGLAKRIENRRLDDPITLNFVLLDQVNEWQESLIAIQRCIDSRFREKISINQRQWPLILSVHSSTIDITDMSNFGNLGNLFGQDIHILSYILSEVFDEVQKLRNNITKMAEYASDEARFLFIERNQPGWKKEIKDMATQANITLSEFHDTKAYMGLDEQRAHLGKLFEDVGRSPRANWDAFWVVGTKKQS